MGPCVRVRWGLLGEWWCIAPSATEEECLQAILAETHAPVSDPTLVRDRLFGGFHCAEVAERRHVYFAIGHYTFLNPEANRPLDEDSRREVWKTLVEENGEPGNGLFTEPWSVAPPPARGEGES